MGNLAGGAQRIDGPPPPQNNQGDSGQPGRTYETDLYEVAKKGATMEPHLPHPDMTGVTAQDVHARSHLFPKDEAARRNEASGFETPTYHEDRAIIGLSTSIPTDNLARGHGVDNQRGDWGAQSSVFEGATPEMVGRAASLSYLPDYYSSVHIPIGSYIEASRPESDAIRQFNFDGKSAWFGESKKLG